MRHDYTAAMLTGIMTFIICRYIVISADEHKAFEITGVVNPYSQQSSDDLDDKLWRSLIARIRPARSSFGRGHFETKRPLRYSTTRAAYLGFHHTQLVLVISF